MATVFKRPGSRYWFACYADRHGKQQRRSTKAAERATAQRLALEWEQVERLARSGQATAVQFQKVVSEVAERVTGEALPCPTVEAYFKEWLDSLQRRIAERTLERYRNSARRFVESLGVNAQQPLRCLTPKLIEQFISRRLDKGLAPGTVILDVKILGIALRRAETYNLIDRNPVPVAKLPKNVVSERGVFSAEDVQRLLDAAPDREWKTLILLGFYLGARLGDCATMRWENVDLDKGLIVYKAQKTDRVVCVPMHLNFANHLAGIPGDAEGFLCPKLAAQRIGGKSGLSEVFIRIVRRAGVDPMEEQGKGLRRFNKRTFHSFRHSFASALANVGVAEEVRMKLTGHASRDMHARYTHLNVEPLRHAISQLPSVG